MDLLGWVGALCFLLAYLLLILKRWQATSFFYHLCNILGGVLLTINTLYDASFPSAFINLVWAVIAAYGMVSDCMHKPAPQTSPSPPVGSNEKEQQQQSYRGKQQVEIHGINQQQQAAFPPVEHKTGTYQRQ